MPDPGRQLHWRQGNVLTAEAAVELGYCRPGDEDSTFVIVVSHDCDLAANVEKEPLAELIVARRIERLGADSYAKTARRLHIEYQSGKDLIAIELLATDKNLLDKKTLFQFSPRQDIYLNGAGVVILQRWLAARYHRVAFPEAFEDRLREVKIPGKRAFLKKIEDILTGGGAHIRALLFDLDDGEVTEREAGDVYQLGIVVLYDSSQDEPTAATAATAAAGALEDLFAEAFHADTAAGWKDIHLKYCDPVSDAALTVAMRETLKQWRLEHMSLQDDPPQAMMAD